MKSQHDVLLIHPPNTFNRDINKGYNNTPPMGIGYLNASLTSQSIRVDVIDDIDAEYSLNDIIAHIRETNPKIVGISATTPQIRSSVQIARAVKEAFKDSITTCIGGCHVSADPTLITRYPYFDFAVIGEGEITFTKLVKQVLGGEVVRGVFTGVPESNLDSLPFPIHTNMAKYEKNGMDYYPLLGTRGCPFKCIFCSRPGLSDLGRNVRSRSAANLLQEIVPQLGKHKYIAFMDDAFTINKQSVYDFCGEITRRGLKFKWGSGGIRLDKIDEEMLSMMVKTGCLGFLFGIESGNERVRNDIIHKGLRNDQIFTTLKMCNKFPVDVYLSFVIGFPTETREEMLETAYFGKKLTQMGIKCIQEIALRPVVPFPGAEIYDTAIREKRIPADIVDQFIDGKLGEDFRSNWPTYVPEGLTKDEMQAIRKKGYISFYFRTGYVWRKIKKDLSSWTAMKRNVREAASLLIRGNTNGAFS